MTLARRLAAFARLARPKFLVGGLLGVALGTTVAAFEGARVDWRAWLVAQLTVSAFQLMTHFSNDYFDREGDARAMRTPFSGGSGILVDGLLPPRSALLAAFGALVLGAAGAAVLFLLGRERAALLAAGIAVLAWSYSSPPLRLLATGLGELDTAIVVGILVPLLAYSAQTGGLDARIVASALPGAFAMFAMMLGVEAPDDRADLASGKRTLLVRLGRSGLARYGVASVFGVYAAYGAGLAARVPVAWLLLGLLAAPPGVELAFAFLRASRGADLLRDAALAARGVAFFVLVQFDGLLGYLAASAWHVSS